MKTSLLKKLTNEELKLLGSITRSDIIEELASRKPRKPKLVINVGDYFYTKDSVGDASLIKITGIEDNWWFSCSEIGIDRDVIDYYNVSYHIEDTSDWVPINGSLYENVLTLIIERGDAVTKVAEQFDNQIRKLCQEVNQNQESK